MSALEAFAAQQTPELADAALIGLAEQRGYVIYKPEMAEPVAEFDTGKLRGERVKVGVVSCTHFGSRFQQRSALQRFIAYAVKTVKVDALVHAGDMCDGPLEMHKGMVHEQFIHTYDAQKQYAAEHLPSGRPWYAISGNHDDSFLKNAGGEIVKAVCAEREDMTYIGRQTGYVRFGDVLVEVTHPHMGGAYALSYRLQKHIEAIAPERKPNIVLMGNFHKVCHVDWRNVAGFMLPAFQAQTSWMAAKSLPSFVGGLILEFGITDKGLAPSIKTEWVIEREPKGDDF